MWFRDWDDTLCGLGTGPMRSAALEFGRCVVRFRDWD